MMMRLMMVFVVMSLGDGNSLHSATRVTLSRRFNQAGDFFFSRLPTSRHPNAGDSLVAVAVVHGPAARPQNNGWLIGNVHLLPCACMLARVRLCGPLNSVSAMELPAGGGRPAHSVRTEEGNRGCGVGGALEAALRLRHGVAAGVTLGEAGRLAERSARDDADVERLHEILRHHQRRPCSAARHFTACSMQLRRCRVPSGAQVCAMTNACGSETRSGLEWIIQGIGAVAGSRTPVLGTLSCAFQTDLARCGQSSPVGARAGDPSSLTTKVQT